jgi:hypothetical protein
VEDRSCLELMETTVHPFPDLRWCAVDIGRYQLNELGCSDQGILDALLADDRSAYSYIAPRPSPFVDVDTQELVHGPYVLSKLDASSFAPSSPEELWAGLQEFVDGWHPVNRTLADLHLDPILVPTLESYDSVYRLPEDEQNFHQLHAEIKILGCFSEFVVIARSTHTVLDIITSQD